MILGEDLDLTRLPPDTTALRLYQIRKPHLPRLQGLERFPLTHLELRWFSAPDLRVIPLPPTLESLMIWHSPQLKSLDGIQAAQSLTTLTWMDTGRLEDARALHALPNLRRLSFEAGMNQGQKIASLAFLDGLPITHLSLNGIDAKGLSLDPVARMKGLEELFIFGRSFAPEELAKAAAAHPALMADLMDLPDYPADFGMRCKKCGEVKKQLFLKGKKFLWCPECETKGLQKNLDWFEGLVAEARAAQQAAP